MADAHPFWLAGVATTGDETVEVTNPDDGSVLGRVAVPTPVQVEQAVAAAAPSRRSWLSQRVPGR